MKKLLLIASAAFFLTLNLNAQCTPDPQYTSSGVYPDSATNFLPGCVGVQYTQLVTNVVPSDTTIVLFQGVPPTTVPIDSINVISVTGLPPGLTFECNNGNCSFPGGTIGCAIISGTPTTAGTYTVVFQLKAYSVITQDITLDYYKIVVTNCGTAGINQIASSTFKMFPNPANDKVNIQGVDNKNIDRIELTDASGKTIQAFDVNGNQMEINTSGLNVGLYFVNVYDANGMETLKLIKE